VPFLKHCIKLGLLIKRCCQNRFEAKHVTGVQFSLGASGIARIELTSVQEEVADNVKDLVYCARF
jgi:hypothetical protein